MSQIRLLTVSDSELNINPFGNFGRTPWTGYQPISRSPPTQDNKMLTYVHVSIGIRIHDANIRAQDHRRGNWSQQMCIALIWTRSGRGCC